MLEIGYGWDIVTLSKETERNREYKHQPVATTPVFYSTISDIFVIILLHGKTLWGVQRDSGSNLNLLNLSIGRGVKPTIYS